MSHIYRSWVNDTADLGGIEITINETNLLVRVGPQIEDENLLKKKIESIVLRERKSLEIFINQHPAFQTSLTPITIPASPPRIVSTMAQAAWAAGVGPMAAVAGAIAAILGEELARNYPEVIVENGGDIFIASTQPRTIGVYAGKSPFTGRLGILLNSHQFPLGICTSAGTVGHSLSFGSADCAMVMAHDTALADAVATALGNRILTAKDLKPAVEWAMTVAGVIGSLAIKGDELAVQGGLQLVHLRMSAFGTSLPVSAL